MGMFAAPHSSLTSFKSGEIQLKSFLFVQFQGFLFPLAVKLKRMEEDEGERAKKRNPSQASVMESLHGAK